MVVIMMVKFMSIHLEKVYIAAIFMNFGWFLPVFNYE